MEKLFLLLQKNFKKKKKITLKVSQSKILIIPPKIWFKFYSPKCDSSFINFINGVHDDKEIKKKIIK